MRAIGMLILAFLAPVAMGGSVHPFDQWLPKKIGEFQAAASGASYTRDTLYRYLDGGAEVYLAFGFTQVYTRRYAGPEAREITLDIYDMGKSEEAYGIFSCDRSDPDAGIGQESEYGYGLLRFWQGRYFVTVTASADDPATALTVKELGQAVLPHLGSAGAKPAMLEFLPEKGLRPERTSYFHAVVSLNNRFFVASDNILHLSEKSHCLLAEYDTPDRQVAHLLLVRYEGAAEAHAARESFLQAYAPEALATRDDARQARQENGRWVMARCQDSLLTVVFEAPDPGWAQELAAGIRYPAT